MSDRLTISRSDLRDVIERASFMVPDRTRGRLRRLATTTPAVAFGWFHCDGVTCPARQIGYRSMDFQTAFDSAMAAHFGIAERDRDGIVVARVVEVSDE